MKKTTHTNSGADLAALAALTAENALCVLVCYNGQISPIVYDRDGLSSLGTQIRTYRPGQVDGRWDGPVLTSEREVFMHFTQSDQPCSVPVALGQVVIGSSTPFAPLPS